MGQGAFTTISMMEGLIRGHVGADELGNEGAYQIRCRNDTTYGWLR